MDSLSERLLLSSMGRPDVLEEELNPPLPLWDGDDDDFISMKDNAAPLWRVLMASRFRMAYSISLRFELEKKETEGSDNCAIDQPT